MSDTWFRVKEGIFLLLYSDIPHYENELLEYGFTFPTI